MKKTANRLKPAWMLRSVLQKQEKSVDKSGCHDLPALDLPISDFPAFKRRTVAALPGFLNAPGA